MVPRRHPRRGTRAVESETLPRSFGVPVLDVIYLVATLALFALVGLIAKGAERL
jgi:hypothetical protein